MFINNPSLTGIIHSSTSAKNGMVKHGFFLLVSLCFISILNVNAQVTCFSTGSGNWNQQNRWDCAGTARRPNANDNAVIQAGHTITLVGGGTEITNLTIDEGGTLNGQSITVSGNLVVNGTHSGTGIISLTGSGTSIDGTGTLSNTSAIDIIGNKTILSSADLTKTTGDINILGAHTITNNGKFTTGGSIITNNTQGTWTNGENSTLNIAGTLLTDIVAGVPGILNAFSLNNIVNYYGTTAYTVKLPSAVSGLNTYYHLVISGSNTRTIPNGTLAIEGDLTINSVLSGNGGSKILRVRGNWLNTGGFTPGAGTVIFDGDGDQYILNSATEDFNNLTINKPSGKLILNANVVVASNTGGTSRIAGRSTLTMLSGDIEVGTNTLTLGRIPADSLIIYTGILAWTSGKIIGPFKRWIDFEWRADRRYFMNEIVLYEGNWYRRITNTNNLSLPTSSDWEPYTDGILFPIGTETHSRSLGLHFRNLTTGLLTAEFRSDYPGNAGLPLADGLVTLYNTFRDGYWALTPEVDVSSTDYDIRLNGDGMESVFTIDADTRILLRPDGVSDWGFNGSHGINAGTVVERNAVTTLTAQFAFGDKNSCLAPSANTIIGNTELCKNDLNELYTITGVVSNTYLWSVIGGQIDGGTGSGTLADPSIRSGIGLTAISVDWGNTGGTGSVSVVEGINCSTPNIILFGPESKLTVTLHAVPPASIAGRINVPQFSTSVETYSVVPQNDYTYQWTVNGGTIQGSDTGASIQVLWGGASSGSVCVQATYSGCLSTSSACLDVTVYEVIRSIKTGNWATSITNNANNIWDCECVPQPTDNIVISNTHSVTITANLRTANNLIIETGGTLRTGTNSSRTLTVTGDLIVNGTLTGTVADVNLISGPVANPLIEGTGNITNQANLNISASRIIFSGAALTHSVGNVAVGAGVKVRNNGTIVIGNTLSGTDADSEWINEENAILEVGGSLLSTGTLTATASNNTVRYNSLVPQEIKVPGNSGQYHNLAFSGTGTKSLPSSPISIRGDFANDASMLAGTGVVNFNGASLISGSITPDFYTVVIAGTLTSSNTAINIAGDFINNGVFNHNGGTVLFNGINPSVINATALLTTFNNLSSSNASGVSVEAANVDLLGILNVTAGTFDADGTTGNAVFSVRSTADSPAADASIAPLVGGAEVVGNVRVERFMAPEGRIYRYLSTPVVANVSDWMDNFPVTGRFPDRSTAAQWPVNQLCESKPLIANNASLYYYDETVSGNQDLGYVAYPITNGGISASSSPLVRGQGYATFIRLCSTGIVIDARGTIHSGQFDLPVTNSGTTVEDGWNLVGNPYPSAISWDSPSWTKTNISNVIAINDNGDGIMRYYDGIGGDPDDFNGIIATGQGFWVRTTDSAPVLTVRENVKVSGVAHSFYRKSTNSVSSMKISLTGNGNTDKAYLRLRNGVSEEVDEWDGIKLRNDGFNLSTVTPQGVKMAINAIPAIYDGMSIPVHITDVGEGNHTVKIEGTEEFLHFEVELIDQYMKSSQLLKWGGEYGFTISHSDSLSSSPDRIFLRLLNKPGSEQLPHQLSVYPNPVKDILNVLFQKDASPKVIRIFSSTGAMLDEISVEPGLERTTIDFSNKVNGIYFLHLVGSTNPQWVRVVKN